MSDESFILVEFPASLNVLIDVTHNYPPVSQVDSGTILLQTSSASTTHQQHFCYIVIFLL